MGVLLVTIGIVVCVLIGYWYRKNNERVVKMDLDKLVNDLKIKYDLDGLLDGELNINDVLEDEIVYEYIREGFDMIEIESYILSQIK